MEIWLFLFWMVNVIIAHGLIYGTARTNWPHIENRRRDRWMATLLSLCGPFAVLALILTTAIIGVRTGFAFRTR